MIVGCYKRIKSNPFRNATCIITSCCLSFAGGGRRPCLDDPTWTSPSWETTGKYEVEDKCIASLEVQEQWAWDCRFKNKVSQLLKTFKRAQPDSRTDMLLLDTKHDTSTWWYMMIHDGLRQEPRRCHKKSVSCVQILPRLRDKICNH